MIPSLTRRPLLSGLSALGGSGLIVGCTPAPSSLRIGTYKGQAQEWIAAAGQAKTPYRLVWSEFVSGNLITEAILAGALDAGSMSEIPPIFVAPKKPTLKLVAVLRGDVNNQVVLVPAHSDIASIRDLKGKRIGYIKSTTSHYILLKILKELGLGWGDVTPVALSPQDGRAAFERGSLDAWVIFGPAGFLARQATGARILTTGLGRLSGNYVIAASDAAIADPKVHGALADYLVRLQKTYAWSNTHPEEAAALAGRATGLPASVYLQQHKERSAPTQLMAVDAAAVASIQTVADTFAEAGLIPGHVDTAALWSHAFDEVLLNKAS